MKHLEVPQKYSAGCRISNYILSFCYIVTFVIDDICTAFVTKHKSNMF